MKSYLIQDTTREEREKIVAESIGSVEAVSYTHLDVYKRQDG